jgi:hypothetical protein
LILRYAEQVGIKMAKRWINWSNFEAMLYDLNEQSNKNSFTGDFLNTTTTK